MTHIEQPPIRSACALPVLNVPSHLQVLLRVHAGTAQGILAYCSELDTSITHLIGSDFCQTVGTGRHVRCLGCSSDAGEKLKVCTRNQENHFASERTEMLQWLYRVSSRFKAWTPTKHFPLADLRVPQQNRSPTFPILQDAKQRPRARQWFGDRSSLLHPRLAPASISLL